jgi:hypothetical protein
LRIWDLGPETLCRSHLLGEHHELHALWSILTKGKKGYAHHPETLRWKGKLKALFLRHENLVREMARRGYGHRSPLNVKLARGKARQDVFLNSRLEQIRLLRAKGCGCKMKRLRP